MEANIEVRVDDNISEIRANNENFEVLWGTLVSQMNIHQAWTGSTQ
jgi:hypothetical protein